MYASDYPHGESWFPSRWRPCRLGPAETAKRKLFWTMPSGFTPGIARAVWNRLASEGAGEQEHPRAAEALTGVITHRIRNSTQAHRSAMPRVTAAHVWADVEGSVLLRLAPRWSPQPPGFPPLLLPAPDTDNKRAGSAGPLRTAKRLATAHGCGAEKTGPKG